MRYASIRSMDISNGTGVGVALFTQGCHFHCPGCHNPEQWSFNGGKEYDADTRDQILELLNRPYIQRFSLLGGEPLEDCNLFELAKLLNLIKRDFPHIQIWCYTGYTIEELWNRQYESLYLKPVLQNIDILVDGEFVQDEKDITLQFKGSANQRIIDLPQSLESGRIVLWTEHH